MIQVQIQQFTKEELATEAGVKRLNMYMQQIVQELYRLGGSTGGTIKLNADLDMRGHKILNQG